MNRRAPTSAVPANGEPATPGGDADAAFSSPGESRRETASSSGEPSNDAPSGAPLITRGVVRMLADHGFAALPEFSIGAGWRMDLCALGRRGEIWCIEVKSSRADFMTDAKWPRYLDWCDRFFFAVAEGFPEQILPPGEGLIRVDPWGGELLRYGPERRLAPARRKTLTLAFARIAATRLRRLSDPSAGERRP